MLTTVLKNVKGRSDHVSFKLIYPLLSRYYEIQHLPDSALQNARLDNYHTDNINGKLIQNQSLLLLTKLEIEKRRNELVKTTSELNQSKRIVGQRNLLLLILGLVIILLLTILYLNIVTTKPFEKTSWTSRGKIFSWKRKIWILNVRTNTRTSSCVNCTTG